MGMILPCFNSLISGPKLSVRNSTVEKENLLRKRKNLRKSKDFSEKLKYSSKCISTEEGFTIF